MTWGAEPFSRAPHPQDCSEDTAVYCPECGMPAWIEWSASLASTGGGVPHVKVRCFGRHWFLMPADYLDPDRQSPG